MSYGGGVVQVSVQDFDGSLTQLYGAKLGPSRAEFDLDEFEGVKRDVWVPVWGESMLRPTSFYVTISHLRN